VCITATLSAIPDKFNPFGKTVDAIVIMFVTRSLFQSSL
jgi:hypothetical protein